MYYKNQTFFIFVSLCFFGYSIFHYARYQDVQSRSIILVVTVVNKSCNAAQRAASGLKVSKNNKNYSVELPYDSCYKYSIGDKVSLLYDERCDHFYLPNYFSVYRFRAIVIGLILFSVIFPWKRIVQYRRLK